MPAVTGLAQRLKGGRMATLRELARRDFFPVFSAKVRGAVYNPFGVLVLAALSSLACGFFLHPQGFALAAGIGVVIAAGALWPLVSLAFLRVSIGFDKGAATEGDTWFATVPPGRLGAFPCAGRSMAIPASWRWLLRGFRDGAR